jgi:hypothetical protein
MDLELKSADREHVDFAWSLYGEFVRKNLFSGGPGRRTAAEWNESAQRKQFQDYWDKKENYVITVDGKLIGWAVIVKEGSKVTVENWQLKEEWNAKHVTSIIWGALVPGWRAQGLEVEAAILQGTPGSPASERLLERLGFSTHSVEQHSTIMRIA